MRLHIALLLAACLATPGSGRAEEAAAPLYLPAGPRGGGAADAAPDQWSRELARQEQAETERHGLRDLGVGAMGTGTSLVGLGGLAWLSAHLWRDDATAARWLRGGGLGLLAVGGAAFAVGATCVGIDWLAAPAPTPDGRGGGLVLAFTL